MGRFNVAPDVVAVAGDRLVTIVRINQDGGVIVRDLANGQVHTASAAELSAPPLVVDSSAICLSAIYDVTDLQWERARQREEAIAGIADTSDVAEQVTRAAAKLGVSRRTIFRWLVPDPFLFVFFPSSERYCLYGYDTTNTAVQQALLPCLVSIIDGQSRAGRIDQQTRRRRPHYIDGRH